MNETLPSIPEELLQAENHFLKLLPNLLTEHHGKWVYVSSDGLYGICDSQDEADIAAEAISLPKNSYVVRIVLPIELPDNQPMLLAKRVAEEMRQALEHQHAAHLLDERTPRIMILAAIPALICSAWWNRPEYLGFFFLFLVPLYLQQWVVCRRLAAEHTAQEEDNP